MTVLAKLLDKAYEGKTPTELLDAPVDALEGVSRDDAELLQKSFNVKTIGDLARNKHFLAAQTIAHLAALHK